jgi:DNA-binding transcriptional ArsR family regulator
MDNIFAKEIISLVIVLRMPVPAAEHVSFELSPLAELAHSWHVLAAPGHHALQVPWVRRCRELPAALRAELREWSWAVRDYVPALFEAGAAALVAPFEEELARVGALPDEHVVADLTKAIMMDRDRPADGVAASLLERVRSSPAAVLTELLDVVSHYWEAAFAEEWQRLEPRLLDAIADAGAALPAGVLRLLGTLAPAIRVDRQARSVTLDRPHDHHVEIAERGPLRLTPSFHAWPHVRATCDDPWPLRLTYPVVPPSPRARRADPGALLAGLRALAGQPRLDILGLLREQPRSTQELSGLLGMSGAAISRHLRLLLDAELVTTRRDGYYVLYQIDPHTVDDLAARLRELRD